MTEKVKISITHTHSLRNIWLFRYLCTKIYSQKLNDLKKQNIFLRKKKKIDEK